MKNQKHTGKLFMAFGVGKESTEGGGGVKRYIGVGAVQVLGVNPSKAELEKFYGTTLEKAPIYLTKKEDGTDMVRLDFIIKTFEEKHPKCPFVGKYSIFLEDRVFTNKDQTKLQVIDKYGETAWITNEEFKTGTYEGKNSRFSTPYRPALVGEEKLIKFIKTYANIQDSTSWDNDSKTFVKKTGQELIDAEASFDNMKAFFKGDLTEVTNILETFPVNKIKLIFGVKTVDSNKMYQDFYSTPIKFGTINLNHIEKELESNKGYYPNTEFSLDELTEYTVNATSFDTPTAPAGLPAGWGAAPVDTAGGLPFGN